MERVAILKLKYIIHVHILTTIFFLHKCWVCSGMAKHIARSAHGRESSSGRMVLSMLSELLAKEHSIILS